MKKFYVAPELEEMEMEIEEALLASSEKENLDDPIEPQTGEEGDYEGW